MHETATQPDIDLSTQASLDELDKLIAELGDLDRQIEKYLAENPFDPAELDKLIAELDGGLL